MLVQGNRNQAIVRKDLKTEWHPGPATKANWVFMGFDEDLNQAMKSPWIKP